MYMSRPAGELPVVFFWKENEENGYLSNWYRRKFVIDDFEYLHVEQYMMAQKAKLCSKLSLTRKKSRIVE